MKKLILTLSILILSAGVIFAPNADAYNFGDFRSETLVSKAWGALAQDDIEGVLAYTNKCLELYADQAKKMQASLDDYVKGSNDDVFSYWALNDVATSLFIQGEAYRKAGMEDEAVDIYKKLVKNYTFGQTWDTNGWFWKPAEAAKEKLAMIESGSNLDFGDYSSSFLTTQAWGALTGDDAKAVMIYTDKVLELYAEKAKQMQASLTQFPWESKEDIFSYWALNDVGTALFIKAEALKKEGDIDKAKIAYKELVDDYYFAQCWDPKGWFWKPAEAAQQALDAIGEI